MSWPWVQVLVLMGTTQVVRAVGDRLGPRWGAIVLGLPSTTAVLLVGGSCELGATEAARAAEIGLLGVVAAVVLPMTYGAAVGRGRGIAAAALAAVVGYILTASTLRALPNLGAMGGLGVALLGVIVGCHFARRLPVSSAAPGTGKASRSILLRSAVPALFLVAIRGLRALAGPEWVGLFATFPAMSLAVLVTLHLEGGPDAACRMAMAMPRGNLGMVAFLFAYRSFCLDLSPFGSAEVGYFAVLVVMAGLVRLGRHHEESCGRPSPTLQSNSVSQAPAWPRTYRAFAPGVESIAA